MSASPSFLQQSQPIDIPLNSLAIHESEREIKSQEIEEEEDEGKTYALRVLIPFIRRIQEKFPDVKCKTKFHGAYFYDSSCYLNFLDLDYQLSIQTDTQVCAHAICETALLSKADKKVHYDYELGYGDVIRHYNEEKFGEHLDFLFSEFSKQLRSKQEKVTNPEKTRDENTDHVTASESFLSENHTE